MAAREGGGFAFGSALHSLLKLVNCEEMVDGGKVGLGHLAEKGK